MLPSSGGLSYWLFLSDIGVFRRYIGESKKEIEPMTRAFVLALITVLTTVASAQDKPKTEIPAAGADGWITLFNGKDLTGWEGLEGFWSVVDGAIQCAETKE